MTPAIDEGVNPTFAFAIARDFKRPKRELHIEATGQNLWITIGSDCQDESAVLAIDLISILSLIGLEVCRASCYYFGMSKSSRSLSDKDFQPHRERRLDTLPFTVAVPFEATQREPWLAGMLAPLSAALDTSLYPKRGKSIGRNRFAGILECEDGDGSRVLIKDVFDLAEIKRLFGRMAQIDARTLIWVGPRFEAQALDQIRLFNEVSSEKYAFFAVRVSFDAASDGGSQPVLDVMQGPIGWVPPVGQIRALHDRDFSELFWPFHLDRHPDEARRSHSVGPRCRLRATKREGQTIGQYVQEDAAVVFLRGGKNFYFEEGGAAPQPSLGTTEQQLAPVDGAPLVDDFVTHELMINAQWRSNWCALSDWLWSASNWLADESF